MEIKVREREGVTILEPKGKITIGEGDIALREAVQSAFEAGASKLVINMQGTRRLDSSGIAELVAARNAALSRGAEVKLSNLPRRVKNVLDVTQIFAVFEIFGDEDEAISSFG